MSMLWSLLENNVNPIFIETGLRFGGCGARLVGPRANLGYKEIYGIELDINKYNDINKKLGHIKNYHLYHGDSAVLLPKILVNITEPLTVWLDAHPDNTETNFLTVKDTPIIQELEAIFFESKRLSFTVMIDDFSLYAEQDREKILVLVKKIGKFMIVNTPQRAQDIVLIKSEVVDNKI